MLWLTISFYSESTIYVISNNKCTIRQKARARKTERERPDRVKQSQRWADSLPSSQPCSHSSRRPDRQHTLLLFALQVKEVSGPVLLVCTSQRLCWREKKNNWARASGGLRCWLSNRQYNVVTGVLKICPSHRPKILSSLKILRLKNYLVLDLKYFTRVKLCLPRGL